MTDLDAHFPRYTRFDPAVPVWCVTPDVPRCLHRFFDTSPISPSGRYLTATQLPAEDRLPAPGEPAGVVLVDLETGEQRVVAQSAGWDTQLGAQPQWGATDEALFFNDLDTATWRPFGVKLNPRTGRREALGGTVYMVSADGASAVSADLVRIGRVQAGYGVVVPPEHLPANRGASDDDGVYLTDTASGACRRVVSIRQVVEAVGDRRGERDGAFYCFHTKLNPAGSRIMLVLRFLTGGGEPHGRSQLIAMDADGGDIRVAIPESEWADKGGHHPNWCPDGEHVMMNLNLHGPEAGMRLVRARYDGSGLEAMTEAVRGSGHPSLHPNGRGVVTDCYLGEPPAFGDGTTPLRWIDLEEGTERVLVRIRTQPDSAGPAGELRVDPHPAWDRSFRRVAFNACPDGTRRVYVADLSALLG